MNEETRKRLQSPWTLVAVAAVLATITLLTQWLVLA